MVTVTEKEVLPVNRTSRGTVILEGREYFPVSKLAEMHIQSLPGSRAGIYKTAAREGWPFIKVQGKGQKDGVAYFLVPDGLISDSDRPYPSSAATVHTARERGVAQNVKVEIPEPSAEWVVLVLLSASEAAWLPDSIKNNAKLKAELAFKLYRLLLIQIGNDESKWRWLTENPDVLHNALRLIYDLDRMEAESKK